MKKSAGFMAAIIGACCFAAPANAEQKPNIIFILADDPGWTDAGTYGSKFHETPNIDKLAGDGMKFMRHQHCQNCQPTRAALMSASLPGQGPGSWRATPVTTIQSGDWKLMEFLEDKRVELYNLKNDIGETDNLAVKSPEKAAELLKTLHHWRTEIKAPMPTPNQPVAEKRRPQPIERRKSDAVVRARRYAHDGRLCSRSSTLPF